MTINLARSIADKRFHKALCLARDCVGTSKDLIAALLCEIGESEAAYRLLVRTAEETEVSCKFASQLLATSLHVELPSTVRADLHRSVADCYVASVGLLSLRPSLTQPIHLGYLSGAFCCAPEHFFLKPIFRHHDRERFRVFAYSTNDAADAYTQLFFSLSESFLPIWNLTDEEAAEKIRKDRIDILIDCTGHFAAGRPGIFAQRAASIQVSFPLYPSTTGLREMDFRIADRWSDPPETAARHYIETLSYIEPGYFCYEPLFSPTIPPQPALKNGYITFGVFGRPAKFNERYLTQCAHIVSTVPQSRILFHHVYNGLGNVDDRFVHPIRKIFARAGVAASRIYFQGQLPLQEHLELLGTVDIGLDTFPYHGMTTTCECLWMGVPVITLAGDCHVSRVGVSILARLGLADWIADSPATFIRLATQKAQGKDLESLRATLRKRMLDSDLLNHAGYVRAIENAYLRMLNPLVTEA